jgi:hypothetical protein
MRSAIQRAFRPVRKETTAALGSLRADAQQLREARGEVVATVPDNPRL